MGKVTVISIVGLDLWFNSSDHLPPHFHATKPGHWGIRIYLLTTTAETLAWNLKWAKKAEGPSAKERRELSAAVSTNRVNLLAEWQQKVVPSKEPK